jgi:hypothetical protein
VKKDGLVLEKKGVRPPPDADEGAGIEPDRASSQESDT